ncbi:MAG: GAF domain-containing protein [Candidatus Krumholzibacteriota bacterium]|nr:GAF domain-containing protein [Candidatus Krumholzibacteriota bacterium]
MDGKTTIAILGGGLDELNIIGEFHRNPEYRIIAVYDGDPRAVAIEIAEILGIPTFSDDRFIETFRAADYIIVSENRRKYAAEIEALRDDRRKIVNPSEAANYLATGGASGERKESGQEASSEETPWPMHLEQALEYLNRITDRERLLKWLLEIAVRAAGASSGSIMLHSDRTGELYIGYASGLSPDVIKNTRQKIGEGIAGKTAEIGTSRLIDDVEDSVLYHDGRERPNILSAISCPLDHEGRLLGVMNVNTVAGEKVLGTDDLRVIETLAGKIAPILDQHLRFDNERIREVEYLIRNYLETLFHQERDFHEKFTLLCRFLADTLGADTATVYTATDEGDWLILGGSDQQVAVGAGHPRVHVVKGSLAKAFAADEEIIMTEAHRGDANELTPLDGGITTIYLPLRHNEPLGVIVLEFSTLDTLQVFLRIKDTLRFQVGFFVYSQLHEVRQTRRMKSLERLAMLPPELMHATDLRARVRRLPEILCSLIGAREGSLHYAGPEGTEKARHNFPEKESERKRREEYDNEVLKHVRATWKPACISFLPTDVDMYQKPPLYRSLIGFPLFRTPERMAVFIAYDKMPTNPLDSSIFGGHDIDILGRAGEMIAPIVAGDTLVDEETPLVGFGDLLRSNQKLFLSRIGEEIERAARYHHGFVVTVFNISGMRDLFNVDYQGALGVVNEISVGVRQHIRKTDFFSWIENDLFGILSIESYQRMGYLEERIKNFIVSSLSAKGLFDPAHFAPSSGYALFPGPAETPADLINEARKRL